MGRGKRTIRPSGVTLSSLSVWWLRSLMDQNRTCPSPASAPKSFGTETSLTTASGIAVRTADTAFSEPAGNAFPCASPPGVEQDRIQASGNGSHDERARVLDMIGPRTPSGDGSTNAVT